MGRLSKSDIRSLKADIRESLDNELSFDLYYNIDVYREYGWNEGEEATNFDINIEVYTDRGSEALEPVDDFWDSEVEDVIEDVASRWGANYWWTSDGWDEGWTIRISVDDNP